jgi:hypothetical protein
MLSDRAMSTRGKGKPVDELDSLCKLYKECIHCAKMEFGNECIPEAVKYNWEVKNGTLPDLSDLLARLFLFTPFPNFGHF